MCKKLNKIFQIKINLFFADSNKLYAFEKNIFDT